MTKKYVTTVTTEWELRGDVPVDRINARIRLAIGQIMMTSQTEDGSYAFSGSDHLLELTTVEVLEEESDLEQARRERKG